MDAAYFKVSRNREGQFVTEGRQDYSFGYNQHRTGDRFVFSASWSWTGSRLIVTGDRYGLAPLFYSEWGSNFAISDSIDQLFELGAPRNIDIPALGLFVRLGYHIGEGTSFANVKALPPGCQMTWEEGDLVVESKRPEVGAFEGSRDLALDIFIETFSDAIRDLNCEGRFVLPLSGGRDSRHILLELDKQNRLPDHCLTLVPPPPLSDEDVRIAKLLTNAVNVHHVTLPTSLNWLDDERKKNEQTHYCADEHGWLMPLGRYLSAKAGTVFDGFAGDILSEHHMHKPFRQDLYADGKIDELADNLISEHESVLSTPVQRLIIGQALTSQFDRDEQAHMLAKELSKYQDQPTPFTSFIFWNRGRREVALSPLRLLSGGVSMNLPFVDTRVFDFLLSCPARFFRDTCFHSDAIYRGYPEYGDISYENKHATLRTSSSYWRKQSICLAFYLAKNFSTNTLNTPKVLPRIIHNAIKFRSDELWMPPQMIVYLTQIGLKTRI